MNIVVVGECGPFNIHLIRTLHEHRPIGTLLRVVNRPGSTSSRLKKLRRAPFGTLVRFAERGLFYRPHRRRMKKELSRQLFGSSAPPRIDGVKQLDVPASDINSKATIELLQSLAPDVLIVSGAPLLSAAVYSIARLGAVNVHRGIAPAYRGDDSHFWSMYFGDYRGLGITIHYLDEGIDTGPVLAQGFPAIDDGESEVTMLAKCSQTAAELLLEFLDVAQRKPSGRSLNGASRLFRIRDRRIWHDARLSFCQNVLRHRIPTRPCSKTVYF